MRKKPEPELGYTGHILIYKGVAIHERIDRVSYPRNGNINSPTIYKKWDVYNGPRSPEFFLGGFRKLRDAKNAIATGEF